MRGRFLNSWNGYQKLSIGINWSSDNIQAGIILDEIRVK